MMWHEWKIFSHRLVPYTIMLVIWTLSTPHWNDDLNIINEQRIPMVNSSNLVLWQHKIPIFKIRSPGLLEGRWYTGKKLCQIWAVLAVHASWYLQKPWWYHLNNHDFILLICPITDFSHWFHLFIYYIEIIIPIRGEPLVNTLLIALFFYNFSPMCITMMNKTLTSWTLMLLMMSWSKIMENLALL